MKENVTAEVLRLNYRLMVIKIEGSKGGIIYKARVKTPPNAKRPTQERVSFGVVY